MRKKFKDLISELGLTCKNLQFYSLRREGATKVFRQSGSFDEVTDRGHWRNVRTARLYVDSALQDLAQLEPAANAKLAAAEKCLADMLGCFNEFGPFTIFFRPLKGSQSS